MIQLTIMQDQAAAILPEFDALRADLADRLSALTAGVDTAGEETRLTRALAIVSALVGQIRTQHPTTRLVPPIHRFSRPI